jgi:hypothetical protein
MADMKTNLRRKAGTNFDQHSADSNSYNDPAGAHKVIPGGIVLKPYLYDPASAAVTDFSGTRRQVPKGSTWAIYNNDTAVHAVTVGDVTVSAQGAGVVSGLFVGVACPPGQYIYINTYLYDFIITDSNKLIVYAVEDDSYMRP